MKKDKLRFRVWSDHHKKYVTSSECAIDCHGVLFDSNDGRSFGANYSVEACLGIHDINGLFVFEGDKLANVESGEVRPVVYRNCRYWWGETDVIICEMEVEFYNLEKTGTIHD